MRRVVTGHDGNGRSIIVSDGAPPRTHEFQGFPGFVSSLVWATEPGAHLNESGEDLTAQVASFVPRAGGTRLLVMVIPPDANAALPSFDGPMFGGENLEFGPGLAELFEPDGMHTTPTVDYSIVLDGEIWLEVDDGQETRLTSGDVVVQNGTRHAWRNKSDKSVTLAAVMTGADRA
jgi:Cupin domain